jgi:hypothetical protein
MRYENDPDMRPEGPYTDLAQREALVSMTALAFIEEYALLSRDKLADAKKSLSALFLRTSGEETFLRKLIETLKATRQIHKTFSDISNILDGTARCVSTVEAKLAGLRAALERLRPTAEENAAFVEPFLSFSQTFLQHIAAFHYNMQQYLERKENEARQGSLYRIARAARDRLKQRLASGLAAEAQGEVEHRIKEEVIAAFDYSEAESNYKFARREARSKEEDIRALLAEIRAMCQMAMNPAMREKEGEVAKRAAAYDDVFSRFAEALRAHPRLLAVKDAVLELFKLYQHAHGIFALDFSNLNRSLATLMDNPEAYFEAKEEDRSIAAKREKLKRIEALIPFLEHAAELMRDEELESYARFSRRFSEAISRKKAPWEPIAVDLLRAKVQAEAELSTQL